MTYPGGPSPTTAGIPSTKSFLVIDACDFVAGKGDTKIVSPCGYPLRLILMPPCINEEKIGVTGILPVSMALTKHSESLEKTDFAFVAEYRHHASVITIDFK